MKTNTKLIFLAQKDNTARRNSFRTTYCPRSSYNGFLRQWLYPLLIWTSLAVSPTFLLAEPLPASAIPEPTPILTPVNAIISTQQHPYLTEANFTNRAEDLTVLYQQVDFQLLWLGKPNSEQNINALLEVLNSAADHGLDAEQYDIRILQEKRMNALNPITNAEHEQAAYDTALSLSLLRFLHDLHYGRINPQGINFNLKPREKKLLDLPILIKTHLDQQTLKLLPELVEPKLRQYQKLKSALAQYRKLTEKAAAFQLAFSKSIRPGDNLAQLENLRDMLVTLGDLSEDIKIADNTNRYSDKIVNGVKNFQRRHGLAADGVIGKTTAAELSTPVQKRVQQIELAMERLRWLPELSSDPSIIVNIPAFQLWAFENINDPNAKITNMRVVVGKAMKNQTPVLMATMSYIDFSPYWNVPYNIVKEEILPKLSQNPGFLAKENMELVSSSGVTGFSSAAIAQLKQGTMRIRQKPGKKNALGRVKFLFPNKNDVYLHDTPSNSLFSRSRRDFSHGCVRVANPEELAQFALKDQKGWDKPAIKKAMAATKLQRVILKKPIPVMFFYSTAFFDEHDQLVFYPDIYNQDTVLQEALKKPEDVPDQALFVGAPTQTPTPAPDALKTVEMEVVR